MKGKKACELCTNLAAMYCKSDRASLCWDCDSRVHGANFLVAKHSRNLLCRSCQSPTPWNASGPRLAPIVSVCEKCVGCRACGSDRGDSARSSYGEGGGDNCDYDGDRDGGATDGDGNEEYQVVPGGPSLAVGAPVATSPSSSKDSRASRSRATAISGKRSRSQSTVHWRA